MSVAKEFREFIARGNVVDLAVGVVIGGAFGSIVKSLVDQVVMPPIGWLMGGVDFSRLQLALPPNPMTPDAEPVLVLYGAFINTIIQFLIVAAAVFVLVKVINSLRRQQAADPAPPEEVAPTPSEALLIEIRDLLKAQAAPKAAPAPKITPVAAKAPVAAKTTPPRKST
ncbi:MAG: large-conductance mechanosensitive channel protein MscL [Caulobacter sp.]|nr:large-conductance mechanosensitive channel protein MscL [Caulobacter sp.]